MQGLPHPSFEDRVRELHAAWRDIERAAAWYHDDSRDAQLQLLAAVQEWCAEAGAVIQDTYGEGLRLQLRDERDSAGQLSGFVLRLETAQLIAGMERISQEGHRWRVRIAVRYPDRHEWSYPRTRGRGTAWTRAFIQDLLLSMLASVERHRRNIPLDVLAGPAGWAQAGLDDGQIEGHAGTGAVAG